MKKIMLSLAIMTFSQLALAGDHWDFCSAADGSLKTDFDTVTQEGSESPELKIKIISETVLKEESTSCKVGGGDRQVVYLNTTSVRLIEVSSDAVNLQKHVICEAGGASIIPQDQLSDCQ